MVNILSETDNKTIRQWFDQTGLNLQAVFELSALPKNILSQLELNYPDLTDYRQIILFAHGGKLLWDNVQVDKCLSDNPIDDYSIQIVTDFCQQVNEISNFKVIYPGQEALGLQALGKLAGWHHESPFKVGINHHWGSWFAYRVAILADSHFIPTKKLEESSPCESCVDKLCIAACPAKALDQAFSLQRCLDYRKKTGSLCQDRCLARMACPVSNEHQYDLEQIKYHYGISMKMIESLGL